MKGIYCTERKAEIGGSGAGGGGGVGSWGRIYFFFYYGLFVFFQGSSFFGPTILKPDFYLEKIEKGKLDLENYVRFTYL